MYELRYYQKDIFDAVKEELWTHKKLIIVAPCGSGKTVISAHLINWIISNGKKAWFIVHRKELVDQAEKTFKNFNIPMENISILMVQSIKNRLKSTKDTPDIIIIDECQHSSSASYLVLIEHFKDSFVIGLTATPARMTGKPLGDIFETMVEKVTASQLIWEGYLSSYDYYAPKIDADFTRAKVVAGDYSVSDIDYIMSKSKIFGDIIKNYKELANDKKTIVYCSSIEYSKKMEKLFNDNGYIAKHFDGNTPKNERDKIIEDFRSGKIKILLNVDLIGEGFDVPDCECVLLLRPTQSLTLYIQQSTRCLRPSPGKKAIIIDYVGNAFRHGLPTEDRKWSLTERIECKNKSGEPEVLVRQCTNCFKCYSGTQRICPYCGKDNGKTRREIKNDEKIELEKIEEAKKKKAKMEQGMCRTFGDLVALGKQRGYKNPSFWARTILKSRR